MAFYPPAWCHSFVRPLAEPIFHPGPHDGAAGGDNYVMEEKAMHPTILRSAFMA
jgi:hypothetical protein